MKKIQILVFAILAFLVGISCYRVFFLYFLNDELLLLGAVRGGGILVGYAHVKTLVDILFGSGRFLGGFLNNLFFYFFHDNPMPFAVFALIVHTLNSYLAYLLAKKVTKNSHIAFITACVFSIPVAANQAISWFAATTQTLGGMTFVLLALLAAIDGLIQKKKQLQKAAWVLAYIAFLFKESSFFVFPLLLLLPYVVMQKVQPVYRKIYPLLLILFLGLGSYKTMQFFGMDMSHLLNSQYLLKLAKVAFNMWFYPLVSLGQFFVPLRFMLKIAPAFAKFNYGFMSDVTADNPVASVIVADMISITLSFICIILMMYVYFKNGNFRKSILFSLCWFVMSFIPMTVFLPERNTSYLESRYLYFSYFPVAMMVGFMLNEVRKIIGSIVKHASTAYVISYIILTLFIYKQVTLMQREINQNVMYGSDIRTAMSVIRSAYPALPDKPIFFVEGDRNFYYPNNVLPFQLGTGYMLSLTFISNPGIPKELFRDSYLWHFFDQGYKEIGDKGFGYFWNKKDLLNFFRTNKNLFVDQLVGIYYYGNDRRVRDTTPLIKEYIVANRYQ
jgi:hypothetical protein